MKQLLPLKAQIPLAIAIVALLIFLQSRLDVNAHFATHYLEIGDQLSREEQDYQQARLSYERALTYEPDNASVHFRLGQVLLRLGLPQQALEHLQTALDFDYRRPVEGYISLGWAQQALSDYDSAIDSFMTALEMIFERRTAFTTDDAASAFSGLGWSSYYSQGCPYAIGYFEEAAKLKPDMDTVRQGLRLCRS